MILKSYSIIYKSGIISETNFGHVGQLYNEAKNKELIYLNTYILLS